MKTTLVILAAGIGARFGGGIKQLEPIGPNGELIIDYSVHDAIAAGFDKIIFIIRRDIEADFREVIGDRIERICSPLGVEVRYAFQSLTDAPIPVPEGRTKPWGTGQAILSCKDLLAEPFAVINSDDYYGKESFIKAAAFLKTGRTGVVGYILGRTLSDNGGVNRGICKVENGNLVEIRETLDIVKAPDGAAAYVADPASAAADGQLLPLDSLVSMNFWCFPANFPDVLEKGFPEFLSTMSDPLKDEYLLPSIVSKRLEDGEEVTVLPTDARWYGVTYKEDKPFVVDSIRKLHDAGVYDKHNIYADVPLSR